MQLADCEVTVADAVHLVPAEHAVDAVAADQSVHAGSVKRGEVARLGPIGDQLAVEVVSHQKGTWRCLHQTKRATAVPTCKQPTQTADLCMCGIACTLTCFACVCKLHASGGLIESAWQERW